MCVRAHSTSALRRVPQSKGDPGLSVFPGMYVSTRSTPNTHPESSLPHPSILQRSFPLGEITSSSSASCASFSSVSGSRVPCTCSCFSSSWSLPRTQIWTETQTRARAAAIIPPLTSRLYIYNLQSSRLYNVNSHTDDCYVRGQVQVPSSDDTQSHRYQRIKTPHFILILILVISLPITSRSKLVRQIISLFALVSAQYILTFLPFPSDY